MGGGILPHSFLYFREKQMKFSIWHLACAGVCVVSYRRAGYLEAGFGGIYQGLKKYFNELVSLRADVLMEKRCGLPVGTLMVSRISEWDQAYQDLPAELKSEIDKLRPLYGDQLAYAGKFATLPWVKCHLIALRLFQQIAISWAKKHEVGAFVIVVHPNQAKHYQAYGGRILTEMANMNGLLNAPGVIMVVDLTSERISRGIARARRTSQRWARSQA